MPTLTPAISAGRIVANSLTVGADTGLAGHVNSPVDNSVIAPSQGSTNLGQATSTAELGGGTPGAVSDSRGAVVPTGSPASAPPPAAASSAAAAETGSGSSVSFTA